MSARGLFITMEGTEGVGKSTCLTFLETYLRENNIDVLVTREPGGTSIGEGVRELLLQVHEQPMHELTELLLIFAARAQHINQVVKPALRAGSWVLCDRFTDATYAYQGGGRGVDHESIRLLEDLVQQELRPDYTVLLDVDVETGMERARNRGELDRIELEEMAFFQRVRARYLELAANGSGRYCVIDAGQSLDAVQRDLATFGEALLPCWGVRHPVSQ